MIGIETVVVALIGGAFGGGVTACLLEAYLSRRAMEEVGVYDAPSE